MADKRPVIKNPEVKVRFASADELLAMREFRQQHHPAFRSDSAYFRWLHYTHVEAVTGSRPRPPQE